MFISPPPLLHMQPSQDAASPQTSKLPRTLEEHRTYLQSLPRCEKVFQDLEETTSTFLERYVMVDKEEALVAIAKKLESIARKSNMVCYYWQPYSETLNQWFLCSLPPPPLGVLIIPHLWGSLSYPTSGGPYHTPPLGSLSYPTSGVLIIPHLWGSLSYPTSGGPYHTPPLGVLIIPHLWGPYHTPPLGVLIIPSHLCSV